MEIPEARRRTTRYERRSPALIAQRVKSLVPNALVPYVEDVYCWYKGIGDRRYTGRPGYAYLPPAALRYQVGSIGAEDFVNIGKACARDLETALGRIGKTFQSFRDILDFGCGCGRTLSWLRDYSPACRFHGIDLNPKAISWCRKHMGFADFVVGNPLPPTSYSDNAFDLVYAISVFTHMDEPYQFAWLRELKRITKPHAVLLISVNGESLMRQLPQEESAKVTITGFHAKPSRSLTKIFPEFYTNTYHTKEYIANKWSTDFKIHDHIPQGMNDHQDLVVLERRG